MSLWQRIRGDFEFGTFRKVTVRTWFVVAIGCAFATRLYADAEAAHAQEPSREAILMSALTVLISIGGIVQQWQKRHGRRVPRSGSPAESIPPTRHVDVPDLWGQSMERRMESLARQISDTRVENVNAVNQSETRLKKNADDHHVEIMGWLTGWRERSEHSLESLTDAIEVNRTRIEKLERAV